MCGSANEKKSSRVTVNVSEVESKVSSEVVGLEVNAQCKLQVTNRGESSLVLQCGGRDLIFFWILEAVSPKHSLSTRGH